MSQAFSKEILGFANPIAWPNRLVQRPFYLLCYVVFFHGSTSQASSRFGPRGKLTIKPNCSDLSVLKVLKNRKKEEKKIYAVKRHNGNQATAQYG